MPKPLATWKDVNPGGLVLAPGSAADYETGTWRVQRPVHDLEQCTHCMMCWVYCPDSSIIVKNGRWQEFDYYHCKGCGVCASVCPIKVETHATTGKPGKVIQMVDEQK
jgi:pyruvate ferredoxin oxidoreductase delta subunit